MVEKYLVNFSTVLSAETKTTSKGMLEAASLAYMLMSAEGSAGRERTIHLV